MATRNKPISKPHKQHTRHNLPIRLFFQPSSIFFCLWGFIPVIFTVFSFGQQPEIDSLKNVLQISKEDTVKINTLNALSSQLWQQGNYEPAMQYANEALRLIELRTPNSELLTKKATAYNNIGNISWYKGDFDKALKFHFKALKIREEIGDKKGMATSYGNIGNVHWNKDDYDQALEFFFKSLKINEEIGDKYRMAYLYNNIGNIHADKGDYDKALEFYFKSLKINEEIGDKNGIAISYNNIGSIYGEKDRDKALEFFFKSLKINEELGDKNSMATSYGNIGEIHRGKGDSAYAAGNHAASADRYDKALKFHFKSLKIKEEIGDKKGIANSYIYFGELNTALKKYDEAKQYLNKAVQLSKEIGAKAYLMDSYNILAKLDSTLATSPLIPLQRKGEHWKAAYEYHKLYSEVKDSIFNEESNKQMAEMQTKYETEKKELQIENLNKDNTIKASEIKKQNLQKIAFASGFGLMLLLAFVIYRGYRQKQKANEIIYIQKCEVEKQKEVVEDTNKSLEIACINIENKNREILDSIHYAKIIQEAMLPGKKYLKKIFNPYSDDPNHFILFKPKDIVSGDFYWFHQSGGIPQEETFHHSDFSGHLYYITADCTGHGVPGGFMSMLGINILNEIIVERKVSDAGPIMNKLREKIITSLQTDEGYTKDGMDAVLCKIDFGKMTLEYAAANSSFYIIRNAALLEQKAQKMPIGYQEKTAPFETQVVQLCKGDTIYTFSDGYADQFGGPKGKKFKYSQFENLLVSIQDKPMREQREILNNTIDQWKGNLEQIDDICVIGVRV